MPSEEREPLKEVSENQQARTGSTSRDDVSDEDKVRFNKMVTKAKELTAQGRFKQALQLNQEALAIHYTEKLAKRCSKMEEYMKQYADESEEDVEGEEMVHVGNGFYLYPELFQKLYAHQREGVLWMWRMYKKRKGGILGDDMGLGKTIQVIAFLSGMFDAEKVHSVLIVLPVAVIVNWTREFEKWAPGIRVESFHGGSKRERERMLGKIHRRGGVVLTSYGMVVTNSDVLASREGREHVWDFVILDEGHKIKNPSNKCSKGLHAIPAKVRIILTGTPIQNNLKEMWALFDWTHQGTLLGSAKTFGMEYEGPIIRARQRDATAGEQRLGEEIAASLQKIINPYFMRRTKAEVKAKSENVSDGQTNDGTIGKAPEMPKLTRKNDLIVWVYLSELQQKIYEDFVNTPEVRELLNSSRSPLIALGVLKKICDHPRLLANRQCVQLGMCMDDAIESQEELTDDVSNDCAANRIKYIDDEVLIAESGKMVFLVELLDNLKQEGHRCLVFSQSRKILNIIQKVMSARGHKVARLDGTITNVYEREEVIKRFTKDKSFSVFLLTTQIGGVGLTLTAADRVVIFDPSWNPATDAQAVDRSFRIGQDKNVVIYRLITCGSIEEKIYRRQIFKDSITRLTTGDTKNPYRYFTGQQLRELFILDNPRVSTTQQQLASLHGGQRKSDTSLDSHIAFLHSLDMYGISDHDLMFSREAVKEHDDDDVEQSHEYIQQRVEKAQKLINLESDENDKITQQMGRYPAPEVNKVRPDARERQMMPTYQWTGGKRDPNSEDLVDLTGRKTYDDKYDNVEALDRSLAGVNIKDDQESMESQSEEEAEPQSPTPPPDIESKAMLAADVVVLSSAEPSPQKHNPAIKSETINLDTPENTPLKSYLNLKCEQAVEPKTKMVSGSELNYGDDERRVTNLEPGASDPSDEDEYEDARPEKHFDKENSAPTRSHNDEQDVVGSSLNRTPGMHNVLAESNDSDIKMNSPLIKNTSNMLKDNNSSPVPMGSPLQSMPGQSPGSLLKLKQIQSKTPQSSRKRRKSVCYHATPRAPSDDEFDPPHNPLAEEDVVREELVFSPRAMQPLVHVEQSKSPVVDPVRQRLNHSDQDSAGESAEEEKSISDPDQSLEDENSIVKGSNKKHMRKIVSDSDSGEEYDSDNDNVSQVESVVSESDDQSDASPQPEREARSCATVVDRSGKKGDSPVKRFSSKPKTPASRDLNVTGSDVDSPLASCRGQKNKRAVVESSDEEMEEEERKPLKRRSTEAEDPPVKAVSQVEQQVEEVGEESESVEESESGEESDEQYREKHAAAERSVEYDPEESVEVSDDTDQEDESIQEAPEEADKSVGDQHQDDTKGDAEREEAAVEEKEGEGEEVEEEEEQEEDVEEEDLSQEEEESEEEDLTVEEEEKYISLMSDSRKLYKAGQLQEALSFALDALEIYSGDDRAKAYALKLQHKLNLA